MNYENPLTLIYDGIEFIRGGLNKDCNCEIFEGNNCISFYISDDENCGEYFSASYCWKKFKEFTFRYAPWSCDSYGQEVTINLDNKTCSFVISNGRGFENHSCSVPDDLYSKLSELANLIETKLSLNK